ncbi:nucleotidyltransferase domain-containing protein [Terrimonas sp. NA20]|uniref:Nucleotidyltransferase domain-containing protein n=1 Tax=Terrimonas ginsenosidimutans TaxID=2908004 RepID=A0ABS9KNQ2_9BACT|nr:nucleotidyltransferase domain-containing protein [Terrimonas ginsenosidimutans]MCG2613958.1 nucleotidyltransferase domain-containing protein [Terrimonas ginsenosidimutans]
MELIATALRELERLHDITILYACETGSRAWGFPSPDSDYDIRFLYRHSKDWYLHLGDRKDSIESMDGDLDMTGWDLRKSLKLLKRSNTALIERFQSPMQYMGEADFKQEFHHLAEQYYSAKAVYFHHFNQAVRFNEEIDGKSSFKLKSYFYLLRSLLSCNWILNDARMLPMHIEGLMIYLSDSDRAMIRRLIKQKAELNESYLHPADPDERSLITRLFGAVSGKGDLLTVNKEDYKKLDQFFIKQLNATDSR